MKQIRFMRLYSVLFFLLFSIVVHAQSEYIQCRNQFISFGRIPTWTGVCINWKTKPEIHLYDQIKYMGHAEYVSRALKTGITFKQFQEEVKHYTTRKYLPFFLFDLRNTPVSIGETTYSWAVKVEDYRYDDTNLQMEETVLKLMKLIEDLIFSATNRKSKGIILLATNENVKPNVSIASGMNKNGYSNLTQSQLIEKTGSKKVVILNEGIAFGYLKLCKKGMEKTFYAEAGDVVIYEETPERIPPVSGIFTMEPQTPLSHVNLLAKNRGTLNVYITDLIYLPGIDSLLGKPVKISAKGDKLSIRSATLAECKIFWEKQRRVVMIEPPVIGSAELVSLQKEDQTVLATNYIGAKALNYSRLSRFFPKYTRLGFAIPFSFYAEHIKSCGADVLIDSLVLVKNKIDYAERQYLLKRIRGKIRNQPLEEHHFKKIVNFLSQHYSTQRIRLRSSTNCEDLPEFNGAGLYLSEGFNMGDTLSKLDRKIRKVYASLWTDAAFAEREFFSINHTNAAMAILVNEAFKDEYANGVVLTIPDKTGFSILINTQPGDHLVTNPENGEVPESILFEDAFSTKYKIESQSSIQAVFLQEGWAQKLEELRNLSVEIHDFFKKFGFQTRKRRYGVDIEFKIVKTGEEYQIVVKQARLLGSTLPE